MRIMLNADREFNDSLYDVDIVQASRDLPRYAGEHIVVNGSVIFDQDTRIGLSSYQRCIDYLNDQFNSLIGVSAADSIAVKRILDGFHQNGIECPTLNAVKEIATINGFYATPTNHSYSKDELKILEHEAGQPVLQTRLWHEIDKRQDCQDILMTERVELIRNGKKCGRLKTQIRFQESGDIEYLGTSIHLSNEGFKVIPETRSAYIQVKEGFVGLLSKTSKCCPTPSTSAFNFFSLKQREAELEPDCAPSETQPLLG